jgi:hypothetical protein
MIGGAIGLIRTYRSWDPSNGDAKHPEYRGYNQGKLARLFGPNA